MDIGMNTASLFLTHFWGKAQPQSGSNGPSWHPLAYHALDVAACMGAILDAWPWALERIAAQAGIDPPTAQRWLLAVAAFHDLGKFADAFQAKAPEHWRMEAEWPTGVAKPVTESFDHGAFGLLLWERVNGAGLLGLAPMSHITPHDSQGRFGLWLRAACSHHGSPAFWKDDEARRYISPTSTRAAAEFVQALSVLFALDERAVMAADTNVGEGGIAPTETWLVAGLCILADWLGSNQRWFSYQRPEDFPTLAAYWTYAQAQAARAIKDAGIAPAAPAPSLGLGDLLPGSGQQLDLSPLQRAAQDLPLNDGPTLAILEDLTGAGKTEAALLLSHRMIAAGKAQGLYWALPTQATSNMLFERLKAAYLAMFSGDGPRPSLALAHGAVDLNDAFLDIIVNHSAADTGYHGDALSATAQCTAWLADDRRKTFMAQVGVGTLDQALLGVLPRWFNTLRLAGLAGKVLVIDEVHSYDAYTTGLTEALLSFQAALGGSAILLSATLTRAIKTRLIAAFARGLGVGTPPSAVAEAFPLISRFDGTGLDESAVASARGTRRDLPVQRLVSTDAAQERLLEAARSGLCAVWIRNSVQDAIDTVDALTAAAPELAGRIALFHSRFTLADRKAIEQAAIDRFGKSSVQEQRAGHILVATQVVEQSLDLDFDVMVSDLAPFDLLIQRAGRLQRHDRHWARPEPVLYLLSPEPIANPPGDWVNAFLPRTVRVYQDPALLWASARVALDGLNLCSDNPRLLLERAYGHADAPAALQPASDQAHGKEQAKSGLANSTKLNAHDGFAHDQRETWDDEGMPGSRLNDQETRVLRLGRWDGAVLRPWIAIDDPRCKGDSRRAWRLSEVAVPAHRFRDLNAPSRAMITAIAAARSTWAKRLREATATLPIVPLRETGDGAWSCTALDGRDRAVQLVYCPMRGLRTRALT